LQNRRSQTLAAPLCVRPKLGAPVSMPLEWSELKKGLKPEHFNLRNALRRIAKFDDPWKPVLGASVDLTKCIKNLHRKYPKD
jgi:bifunctional non-homologous end joining protein LigD